MLLHFVEDDEYAFYFPDASDFDRHWEEAQANPDQNYHIKASLESVFGWIEVAEAFGESPGDKIWNLIDNSTAESQALVAAGAAVEWYQQSGRDGGRAEVFTGVSRPISICGRSPKYGLIQMK